jgi:hypothetical protein
MEYPTQNRLVVPILAISRQQLAARITRRDRSPQSLQFGFEKMVGDDQRLDRLTGIAVAGRDGLVGGRL